MDFTVSVLQNLALLSFVGLGLIVTDRYAHWTNRVARNATIGVILGLGAFLVTVTPITLYEGATVDARAGPVIISAFLAGPLGAAITATIGAAGRAIVGGNFAFSGVVVYFVYAFFGWLLFKSRAVDPDRLLSLRGLMLLCLASFLGASLMYFLISPPERATAWLVESLPNIYIANGLSVLMTVLVVDLTLRILDNFRQTQELNETLNLAKRAGRFGIWEFDIARDSLKWDARSAEIHGIAFERAPTTYQQWSDLVSPLDLDRVEELFQRSIDGLEDFETEYRTLVPGRPEKIVRGNAILLYDAQGQPLRVVGTNQDLTELRDTERALERAEIVANQAQKFDTIGKLTGGVAHDFNNLLAIIMGNQELLMDAVRKGTRDTSEVMSYAESTVQAVRRGSELTNSMLAYARQATLEPAPTDINQIVRETERWIVRTLASSIAVETVLQAGIWEVSVDRSSLQSALVNLIVNARDAMEEGGKLTIETANVRIDEPYIESRNEEIPPGRYVMIAVSDTGSGIDETALSQIFDPFFTTKPVGKGTGLGLSMVEGFVRQSGGSIRVYSEPGVGTSFKLYFQASEWAAPGAEITTATPDPAPVVQNGRPRVLVVEDNAGVLEVLSKSLEASGYAVTQAESGDVALEIFRRTPDFDIVLTDIVMPGKLQGPGLAHACREIRADIPFIFFSGYASEATVHGNGLHPDDIRLMKPISKTELLQAITRRLASTLD
jgi:signal transduction histidine kinase/ActR/RegA family two-component response regulator